jgi:polar amino acid transport system permease protein
MLRWLLGIVVWCALTLRWHWLPRYSDLAMQGLWRTIWLLALSCASASCWPCRWVWRRRSGRGILAVPARAFCTVIRGTPLLLQLWLIYFGLGSLFPQYPWIRESELWPYLRAGLALCAAGADAQFRGLRGRGDARRLQERAARPAGGGAAMGMPRFTMFRRIWLPQAMPRAADAGRRDGAATEGTPLVATITVVDIYAVTARVRQDTFIIYEPLLLLTVVYLMIAGLIVLLFRWLDPASRSHGSPPPAHPAPSRAPWPRRS